MKWIKLFATAGVVVLAAAGAHANWQYAKWGMSPGELLAASKGAATSLPFDPASVDPMLRNHLADIQAAAPSLHAAYSANGVQFDAQFHFSNGKLDRVYLQPTGSDQCPRLLGDLNGQYGQPSERYPRNNTTWWRDTERGNHVMFTSIGGGCSITYEPLATAERTGL